MTLHADSGQGGQDHSDGRNDSERGMKPVHAKEHDTGMKNYLDNQHAHIGQRIPDSVDVILDARHQFAGVRLVKEAAAQTLDMVKQVFPHIGGNRGAYFVEGVFLGILKNTPPDTDNQDATQQIGQCCQIAAQYDIVNNMHGEHWRQHIKGNADKQRNDGKEIMPFVFPDVG